MPQEHLEHATSILSWWKELTGLLLGVLALFGISIKSRKGNNLVTKVDLELALSKHSEEITSGLKRSIEETVTHIYNDINTKDYRTNQRIDSILDHK